MTSSPGWLRPSTLYVQCSEGVVMVLVSVRASFIREAQRNKKRQDLLETTGHRSLHSLKTGRKTYYTGIMRISGSSWVISFDDIQILIANKTQEFYLRKSFNWPSPFNSAFGIANVLSDDSATVWLNGHRIDADSAPHPDQYWNRRGKIARGSWLRNGTHVV